MPSWNDGETSSSSGSLLSEFADRYVPETIYDPDFDGMEDERCKGKAPCNCHLKLRKYVCFEGENVGRRFLGCSNLQGTVCSTVDWIDPEWPAHLKKCLMKLWELYDFVKTERLKDNCDAAEKYYKLSKEKEQVEELNQKLQSEVAESIKDYQVGEISQTLLAVHKLLREKAEKQRDVLKEEKKKLEYYIAELLKAGEKNKEKLQKLKDILNE